MYLFLENQEQRSAAGIQLRDLQSMLSGLTGAQGTTEKPPGEVTHWVCFIIWNIITEYFVNIFFLSFICRGKLLKVLKSILLLKIFFS